jgi:hypothetical protein
MHVNFVICLDEIKNLNITLKHLFFTYLCANLVRIGWEKNLKVLKAGENAAYRWVFTRHKRSIGAGQPIYCPRLNSNEHKCTILMTVLRWTAENALKTWDSNRHEWCYTEPRTEYIRIRGCSRLDTTGVPTLVLTFSAGRPQVHCPLSAGRPPSSPAWCLIIIFHYSCFLVGRLALATLIVLYWDVNRKSWD